MTIKDARIIFTSMVPFLINRAIQLGFKPALDMAKRCPDCKVGHEKSLHKLGLAVDLLLYDTNGKYLTDGECYKELAEYWESIGGSSGYRFNDANHFSYAFNGMK